MVMRACDLVLLTAAVVAQSHLLLVHRVLTQLGVWVCLSARDQVPTVLAESCCVAGMPKACPAMVAVVVCGCRQPGAILAEKPEYVRDRAHRRVAVMWL